MKILFWSVVIVIAIGLILLLIRLRYTRLVQQIWRSLRLQPTGLVFTPNLVEDLDEPVRRYFLHAIAPGTPLASCVELTMKGSFQSKPNADWLPMTASQIVSLAPGFIWRPNIGRGSINFSGADYFYRGRGRTKFALWGIIPLVDAHSQDIARSAVGRLAAEYIWLPAALLPQSNITWKAISEHVIQASFKVDQECVVLTLTIDAEGRLKEISLPRWCDRLEPGNWQYNTFTAQVETETTFGGYTIPNCVSAGWLAPDPPWIFFKSNLQTAEFF